MVDPLAPLLADGVIDDVVARLKSGKEADLWIVRHRGEAIAAKVYKARESRSFRNDAVYREGRQVRDTRTQRAMARGSRFGQAASEEAWKSKEADALHALHAAGVRVPTPVMFYEGILLMELVLGPDGHPAPRLIDAHLTREGAAALYADLRGQVVRMLGCDLIHGDLSPYNVLLGRDGPVVIDFPQVIGAAHNSQAERFFERDLENLRRFFAALDPALHAAAGDAREIWRAYVRRELTPDFVPSGKAPEAPRGGAGQGQGQAQRARGEHRRDDRRERRPGGSHGEERRRDHGGRDHGARDAPAPRAEREHRPRPEPERRGGGHEPRGRGGPPPAPPTPGRGAPRRDRGPRMPEVVRVARPPLSTPSNAPRAHPPPAVPSPAPRPHAPRPPHAGGEAESPRAAHPQQQQREPHPHPQQGSRPAASDAAAPTRRRRRRRRGPRSG